MGYFTTFARLGEIEFADIVISTHDFGHKLRFYLNDKSFVDIFTSLEPGVKKFSIHCERRHIDGTIYRIDNTSDKKWNNVQSFPIHFHDKEYFNVTEPPFPLKKDYKLEDMLRSFLAFAQSVVNTTRKKE